MKLKRFTVSVTAIAKSAFSISFRLLLFNVLLVFLPIAAVLYLDVYEDQLLVSQEKTMVQQGRILSASLSERGSLDGENVQSILHNLAGRTETRLRVLDNNAMLLGDSSSYKIAEPSEEPVVKVTSRSYASLEAVEKVLDQDSLLYRLATYPIRLYRKLFNPPVPVDEPDDYDARSPFSGYEVQAALAGRYGAATRLSTGGQRSVTLYTAIPVMNEGAVVGVVLSSQSTYRILKDLYEIRLFILRIFLASLIAALIISLFLSLSISTRIKKLRREATSINTGKGQIKGSFSEMKFNDEIGDLSRSLIDLTGRLDRHIRFTDSLARDMSHEFKNPLAVIRSAADMAEGSDGEEKERFTTMIKSNVARMESLLNGVEEIAKLDRGLAKEQRKSLEINSLLDQLLEGFRIRFQNHKWMLNGDDGPLELLASEDRFCQVMVNLYENALSFAEEETAITTCFYKEQKKVYITVENVGPPIPREDLHKIFNRFYTTREEGKEKHHGLGLSIVKTIVEDMKGTVKAENLEEGPRFTLTFPLL